MEGAGAAAIVPDAPLLNMLAAAAEPVDAAQPDELPAVPTAVGVAPDDEADGARVFPNDPRYLSACSIQPGCAKYTLAGWQPSSEKPAKKHLILAMGTRQLLPLEKQPQPASWPVQKIADWLYKHPPTAAGPLVPAQLVPLDAGGGSGSSPLAIAGAAGGPAVPDILPAGVATSVGMPARRADSATSSRHCGRISARCNRGLYFTPS